MFQTDENWARLQTFIETLKLNENAAVPGLKDLFQPSVDFTASLFEMVDTLDHHGSHITAFDRQNARNQLLRAARHLVDAIVTGFHGTYVSGAVIYRVSVEALFHSTYTHQEVVARLPHRRRAELQGHGWQTTAVDYRNVLKLDPELKESATKLHRVYQDLSKVAHGERRRAQNGSVPHPFDFHSEDATKLGQSMCKGNAAAGEMIRRRLRPLFTAASLDRTARFDQSVAELKARANRP